MKTQTHPTPSTVQKRAAARTDAARTPVRASADGDASAAPLCAPTLGAARLRMASERTTSCLGATDYPREAPFLVVVMLLLACASCVLLIALVLRFFGL